MELSHTIYVNNNCVVLLEEFFKNFEKLINKPPKGHHSAKHDVYYDLLKNMREIKEQLERNSNHKEEIHTPLLKLLYQVIDTSGLQYNKTDSETNKKLQLLSKRFNSYLNSWNLAKEETVISRWFEKYPTPNQEVWLKTNQRIFKSRYSNPDPFEPRSHLEFNGVQKNEIEISWQPIS